LRAAAWNLGFSAASLVAGVLIVNVGYQVTFLDLVVFTVLAMVIFVGYYSRHPRVQSGELSSALPRWRRKQFPSVAELASERELVEGAP
jgi:MFS family permease